ncbi:MAG: nucleoside triphosphate pyrophosphohydrolase [Gammaproteobacteria bacterium]
MKAIEQLLETMASLRDLQNGCAWVSRQTMASILPFTLEEIYELMAAVEEEDEAEIRDELSDLLYHVVYYAAIAREAGMFDFDDIADHARQKQIRRHPHVFSPTELNTADAVQGVEWERRKRDERTGNDLLGGVNLSQPALIAAVKLQKRAAAVGFDWPNVAPVLDKIEEEIREVRQELQSGADLRDLEEEIGDLLFSVVNAARHAGCEPEAALRRANRKFIRRFRHIETALQEHGRSLEEATMEEMEALWQEAKKTE